MKRFNWQTSGSKSKSEQGNVRNSIVSPILTILVIVGIIYLLFGSSIFSIKRISVSGNEFVDSNLVETSLRTQLEEKRFWFLNQSNTLVFDERAAVNLIQHPRIEEVRISKQLPGTIVVTIKEKEATAIWHQQNRWFELDQNGQIISETGGPKSDSIILIDTKRVDPSNPGASVTNKEVIDFITVISSNVPRGLGFDITKYDIADWNNYSITGITSAGWGLRFSTQLPISDQIYKLKTFFVHKNQSDENWKNSLHYIDLRFGNSRIYYQ